MAHDLKTRYATEFIGTVKSNCAGYPRELLQVKNKHEMKFATCSSGLLAVAWMDVKEVCLLSTIHNAAITTVKRRNGPLREEVPAPTAVRDYNAWMGGCDHADQFRSRYCMVRRNVRSYMAIFWWLMDIVKVNAFSLYSMKHDMTHDCFLLSIAESLMQSGKKRRNLRPPPAEGTHECVKHPLGVCRRCKWCYSQDPKGRAESTYWCPACRVHMHRECFSKLHVQAQATIDGDERGEEER